MSAPNRTNDSRLLRRFLTCILAVAASDVFAQNWPAFQNGGRSSLSTSDGDSWSLGQEPLWTAELRGYGQSSPVIWGDHVYLTSVEGANKDSCHALAFSLDDGHSLWTHSVSNASPVASSNYVSRAAPTCIADSDGVVCLFEGGNLVALTHAGKVRWERNLVADYGSVAARHGLSSSLEQDADSVFVWVERSESPYLLSLNKSSGTTNWKSDGIGATSWASPRLVDVGDRQHLVLSAIGTLAGFHPKTGERLWTLADIDGNSTPTPFPLGNARFLIGATVGRGGDSSDGRASESNGVVEIRQLDSGSWQADYIWRAKQATSSFGSPIVHNGIAVFVNRSGVLYGLDAATGEQRFAKRLSGSSWATPIGLGSNVFFASRTGTVDVVNFASSEVKVSKWNGLPADAPADKQTEGQASPFSGSVLYATAVTGNRMLLRRGDRLYAVSLTKDRP